MGSSEHGHTVNQKGAFEFSFQIGQSSRHVCLIPKSIRVTIDSKSLLLERDLLDSARSSIALAEYDYPGTYLHQRPFND